MSSPTGAQRPPLAWVALGLLAALVTTNAVFLALLQTGGPLIGLVLYAVLLWRWRQRDYQAAVVGGLVGLAVHVVEVITTLPSMSTNSTTTPPRPASPGWS